MPNYVEDQRGEDGKWLKSVRIDGVQHTTKSGLIWQAIRSRCMVGGSRQRQRPKYIGCTYSENFADFQFFADWHTAQIGYGKGYAIDKDLLKEGNKVYHEDLCVLVPQALNSFLVAADANRGKYPQGVSKQTMCERYIAQCSIGGKQMYLGSFATVEEASAAYKAAKEAEARRWYMRLVSGEFEVDPRVIERMRTWEFNN